LFNLGDLGGHSINKFTFIAASLFGAGITAGKKALAENIEKQKPRSDNDGSQGAGTIAEPDPH